MHTGSTKVQIPRFYLDTTTVLFRYDCYMIRVRGFNGSYSECKKYRFTKKWRVPDARCSGYLESFFSHKVLMFTFFSQVFECINPNNKELAFVLSVSIPYKRKLFMIKSSKRKDLTHF